MFIMQVLANQLPFLANIEMLNGLFRHYSGQQFAKK
jgi:hypothetical protein